MLEEVKQHFPECLAWAITCYGAPSHLKFGKFSISSSSGLHQGDPLAGLLFCLALKPIVDAIQVEVPTLALNACYLDDMHMIGTAEELTAVVDIVLREGMPRGLILSCPLPIPWKPQPGPSHQYGAQWLFLASRTRTLSREALSGLEVGMGSLCWARPWAGEAMSEK